MGAAQLHQSFSRKNGGNLRSFSAPKVRINTPSFNTTDLEINIVPINQLPTVMN